MEPGKKTRKFLFSPVPVSLVIPVLLLVAVLLSTGCTSAFFSKQNTVPATPVSPPGIGNPANQITMQVVMVDETAHADYTTVWLTPSARIYTLAKNIPEYRMYIGLMEQSIQDGSFLTFTLDTQDSPQGFSIIKSVAKGVQPTPSPHEEEAMPVAQPVSPPDGVNPAHQVTMQVLMVDENAHAEYTTVWFDRSERIYRLPKNIPDYQTYIGLMEQSKNDGTLLTFTLDTQDSTIITSVAKGVQPAASSPGEKAVVVAQPVSSPDGVKPAGSRA